MAVIFWAVGGVVASAILHDDHSAHSDYDNYSNHSDYSDYAERQRRRLASLKSDTESAARELSSYKSYTVNPELDLYILKTQTAMRVDQSAMDEDARSKIQRRLDADESSETSSLNRELVLINNILDKISHLEKESQ